MNKITDVTAKDSLKEKLFILCLKNHKNKVLDVARVSGA